MPKELIGNFKHGQDIESDDDNASNMPADSMDMTDAS